MNTDLPEPIASYLTAYNARDIDALLATVTDDVVFENVSNHGDSLRTEGRAAFEALARQSALAFSSRCQSVVEAVLGGDRVALLIDYEATFAADGRQIRLRGSSFFRLRDGLIARIVDSS
jgi:hypothetical protein